MKKSSYIVSIAIFLFLIVTSCKKEDYYPIPPATGIFDTLKTEHNDTLKQSLDSIKNIIVDTLKNE